MSTSLLSSEPPDRLSSSFIPGAYETDNEYEMSDVEGDWSPSRHDSKNKIAAKGHSSMSNLHETSGINLLGAPRPTPGRARSDNSLTHHTNSVFLKNDHASQMNGFHDAAPSDTVLEEAEMNQKLAEFESSFVPELSHLTVQRPFDDEPSSYQNQESSYPQRFDIKVDGVDDNPLDARSPRTPPNLYKTPAPEQQELRLSKNNAAHRSSPDLPTTSQLEFLSSSPTAARTVSRVQSMASLGGYETAEEQDFPESPTKKAPRHNEDPDATPRKNNGLHASQNTNTAAARTAENDDTLAPNTRSRRPKYLNSRSATSRLSYDSVTSSTTEASDATLGADFALQSGGAAPESRLQRKPRMTLSRSTSLGSIVSGVSSISDDEGTTNRRIATGAPELSTLEEESTAHTRVGGISPSGASVVTPRPSTANLTVPSETVITNHVKNFEVPGSFARQYRQSQNSSISPDKSGSMVSMTPSASKGLTLKEHRSTVEKLGKENFDLKMKIHFLDQALQRRSEDGVKDLITENVQLKSDRMRLEKENHGLRKQVRELQKKVANAGSGTEKEEDQGYATDEERRSPTAEEELMYLRERVEIYEVENSRLRKEGSEREGEKRRLAEMVKSLGDRTGTGSDVGSREERDMWKDMLEAETIAREQSEEETKKLRDEIAKLRSETFGSAGRTKKLRQGGSIVSRSSSVEGSGVVRQENAEVERLRHEVSELQKMIGAQASTLTSRNKEKERLYQEIEDLKIGRMGGIRSVAGDSILDRSASRARSNSRASNGTRFSRLSEPEREQFESRIGELRDEVSQLKLDNQNLQNQFEEALAELDGVDAQAQADVDQFNEELMLLAQERDNALREAEDQDQAFQQLKNEAQEEIDGLGDELDAKVEECDRLEQDLKAQAESVNALQAEMRSASEGLVRLEEDAQQNLARYQSVKAELDDANRELESMEKNLAEAESKIQRLTVEQESSHNEIAFLREEQDGDKIKIGDLESLLKKVHLNLDSERDRAKDLDRRLAEERQQKEAVSNQEKQDVQRMLNDLNREASAAKDELRRVKKALSSREIEVATYKEKLTELEESLRHTLRDPNATRSGLISTVAKMQRELDQTSAELDRTQRNLNEHQDLLANRDALLESSSLEYRKLTDVLERERQARRQDKHSFEQSLKSHQQSARALSANNARIAELEQARQGHRKQITQLEAQYKDQLSERNQVLLTLWKKLSALCGPDWAHNHSLINGNLPSQEVVGNVLFWPGFSRNLLLAAKQVEGVWSNIKEKIKKVERELWKEYRNLEQTLDVRTKKLERIEESWEKMKLRQQEIEAGILSPTHPYHHAHRGGSRASTSQSQQTLASGFDKFKNENRALKAGLQALQRQQNTGTDYVRPHNRSESRISVISGGLSNDGAGMSVDGAPSVGGGIPTRTTSVHYRNMSHVNANGIEGDVGTNEEYPMSPTRDTGPLMISSRPYPQQPAGTSNSIQAVSTSGASTFSDAGTVTTAALLGMGQERWIHRLRELERRLKSEREQRLIDRSGMRKRLEEREAVNESLRKELERERVRRSWAEGDDDFVPEYSSDQGTIRGRDAATTIGRISVNNRVIDVANNNVNEVEGSPVRAGGASSRGR